jgi:tetratricopeptide (TPR) repeat protein
MGQYEAAASDIDDALALDPDSTDAWRQKALLKRSLKEWDDALTAADKLITLVPDEGAAYVLRARIRADGFERYHQALEDYQRAIALDPIFYTATLVERWHIFAELGMWEEALSLSYRMIAAGSEDPLRYFYQGWSLIQLHRIDEAINKLFFAIREYPDYPVMFYYALGIAYSEREAWDQAVHALEVALLQSGEDSAETKRQRPLGVTASDIMAPLGLAYLKLQQCETGGAILERAITESPNPGQWLWARRRIDACYISLTPTPTPEP